MSYYVSGSSRYQPSFVGRCSVHIRYIIRYGTKEYRKHRKQPTAYNIYKGTILQTNKWRHTYSHDIEERGHACHQGEVRRREAYCRCCRHRYKTSKGLIPASEEQGNKESPYRRHKEVMRVVNVGDLNLHLPQCTPRKSGRCFGEGKDRVLAKERNNRLICCKKGSGSKA
eukprot:XP_001708443.1 Hypothetical protein GL50803_36307 [Giardia lamblia ATCC 50803]